MRRQFLGGVLAVLAVLAAGGAGAAESSAPPAQAELVSEYRTAAPGATFRIGLLLQPPPDWHTYWRNPGDAGIAPDIAWTLPEDVRADDLEWPAPQRFEEPPLTSFGFAGPTLLTRRIHVSSAATAELQISANVSWLICRDICVPESHALTLRIPMAETPEPAAADVRAMFAATAAQRPRPPEDGWRLDAVSEPGAVTLRVSPPPGVPAGQLTAAQFFPATPDQVEHGNPPPWQQQNGVYLLRLTPSRHRQQPLEALRGVLTFPPTAGDAPPPREVVAPVT